MKSEWRVLTFFVISAAVFHHWKSILAEKDACLSGKVSLYGNSIAPKDVQRTCHLKCLDEWEHSGKFPPGRCDPFNVPETVDQGYKKVSPLWKILDSNDDEKVADLGWQRQLLDKYDANFEFWLMSQSSLDLPIYHALLFKNQNITLKLLLGCSTLIFLKGDYELETIEQEMRQELSNVLGYASRWSYCVVYGKGTKVLEQRDGILKPLMTANLLWHLLSLEVYAQSRIVPFNLPQQVLDIDFDVYFSNWDMSVDDWLRPYTHTPLFLMASVETRWDLFCTKGWLALLNAGVIMHQVQPLSLLWFTNMVHVFFDLEFTRCLYKGKYSERSDQARFSEILAVHGLHTYYHQKRKIEVGAERMFEELMSAGELYDKVEFRTRNGNLLGTLGLLPPRVMAANPVFEYGSRWQRGDFMIHAYSGPAKARALPMICSDPVPSLVAWCNSVA